MAEQTATERVVMIPVDASENAERAFDYYIEHVRRADDKVLLLNVYEIFPPTGFVAYGGMGAFDASLWEIEVERTKKLIKQLKKKYEEKCKAIENLNHEFKIHRAPVGEAVIQMAKDNNVKMIVMGTRGLGVIRRTILGSVSDYVLHHSHLPTMVVP